MHRVLSAVLSEFFWKMEDDVCRGLFFTYLLMCEEGTGRTINRIRDALVTYGHYAWVLMHKLSATRVCSVNLQTASVVTRLVTELHHLLYQPFSIKSLFTTPYILNSVEILITPSEWPTVKRMRLFDRYKINLLVFASRCSAQTQNSTFTALLSLVINAPSGQNGNRLKQAIIEIHWGRIFSAPHSPFQQRRSTRQRQLLDWPNVKIPPTC